MITYILHLIKKLKIKNYLNIKMKYIFKECKIQTFAFRPSNNEQDFGILYKQHIGQWTDLSLLRQKSQQE